MRDQRRDVKAKVIVVHKDCVDGFLSEVILRDLYPEAEVLRLRHEMPEYENLEPRLGMLFCDIAPPAARAGAFFSAGAVVFDHHKSAAPVFEIPNCTRRSRYSMGYGVSGGVLAYQHWCEVNDAFPDARSYASGGVLAEVSKKLYAIARFVGLYDTWCDTHVDFATARQVHAVLDLLMRVRSEITMTALVQDWLRLYLPMGGLLVDEVAARARGLVERAAIETWDCAFRPGLGAEMRVAMLPRARHDDAVVNEAAAQIAERADLVISGMAHDGMGALSYRSRGDSVVDCEKLAAELGGGGHRGAAGSRGASIREVNEALRRALLRPEPSER